MFNKYMLKLELLRLDLPLNMLKFNVATDVCIFCAGLTIGKTIKNRCRRKSNPHDEVLVSSNHAAEDQLTQAGINRHCVEQLSICPQCQRDWQKPDFDKGSLIYPKVCLLGLIYIFIKCNSVQ